MTGDTKQEILYSALMKLKERYVADMKWSSQATEHEKTLVAGNLNGFCSFLSHAMPENANDSESQICKQILDIMKTYHEQDAKGYVDSPGGLDNMGDVWRLFRQWEIRLTQPA